MSLDKIEERDVNLGGETPEPDCPAIDPACHPAQHLYDLSGFCANGCGAWKETDLMRRQFRARVAVKCLIALIRAGDTLFSESRAVKHADTLMKALDEEPV